MDEAWGIVKNRKESTIHSSKILDFHYELMNQFKFTVPIEPRLLVQMIHPHHGYLSNYTVMFLVNLCNVSHIIFRVILQKKIF